MQLAKWLFRKNTFNSFHLIAAFGDQLEFSDALAECRNFDGELAQIQNQETHDFLADYILSVGGT